MTPLLLKLKKMILALEYERTLCDSQDLADKIYALQSLALELTYYTRKRQ